MQRLMERGAVSWLLGRGYGYLEVSLVAMDGEPLV